MFIRTERLFLRPAWPEDLDDLLAAFGGDALFRNSGVAAFPRTRRALREYLKRPRQGALPQLVIHVRDEHGAKLVGGVGLGRNGDDVELGYWIARGYQGKGYAAEAVRAVLAQARALGHRRIVAARLADTARPDNVLEQLGFKATGETRSPVSAGRGGEAPVRLYAAVLADKLFDMLGVGPQQAAA